METQLAHRVESATARTGGFVPIECYAAIGDGRTVALVATDGQIDWWPVPTMDAPPAFAAVLDPDHGGHIALHPDEPFSTSRRYVRDTNVLETVFATESGQVRVTDAMSVGRSGRLPCNKLIRRIEGLTGHVRMRWDVAMGNRFGTARPWTESRRGQLLLHLGDQHLALRAFEAGPPQVELDRVSGDFTTSAGSQHLLALVSSDDAPVFLSDRHDLEADLELTIQRWQEWTAAVRYEGDWRDAVHRSALALKLMLFTSTGAIAAAPTTSLPERIGGKKNFDYRYMWVRDASFTADALISLRLHEEAQAGVNWLIGTVRETAPDIHVFYKLDGSVPRDEEDELPAPGYRNSQPVRSGNSAASQIQLGTFGDFFDTIWRYVEAGHMLDPDTGRLLADLADRCCDQWITADAGIWELHQNRHYTISKIGCWTALDRAVRLAELGEIATEHAQRWKAEAERIKDWVNQHCWSDRKQSYTCFAGTDDLDAATLLAGRTGFDRGERLAGTISAIRRELGRGPLVYRYSGMAEEEGCFLACTFWLVSALASLDRHDEARELMAEAVRLTNDVGLLSEQMDPSSRTFLGNFPQGLSHLALINAAVDVARGVSD